jgi:hypothetical protein
MQHRTRRLGLAAAVGIAIALGAGLIGAGAGVAVAAPTASQAPTQEGRGDDQIQQMDEAMEECLDEMPAETRDEAWQMHEQMRRMMSQMMDGMDGMGQMGGSGMGGMMSGSGDEDD